MEDSLTSDVEMPGFIPLAVGVIGRIQLLGGRIRGGLKIGGDLNSKVGDGEGSRSGMLLLLKEVGIRIGIAEAGVAVMASGLSMIFGPSHPGTP